MNQIIPSSKTEEYKLKYGEETRKILGCAMTVLNTLGHGLLEKPYENALCVELGIQGISYIQQKRFEVFYKSVLVGEYIPDLIVLDSIIVDLKTVNKIGNIEIGQMINYLRITSLPVGLIINFKYPRLEWDRVIL